MYSLTLTLQGLPKTTNGHCRKHWRALQAESIRWQKAIIVEVGDQRPPHPLKKAHLIYTRHSSQRPDHDGLVSTWKHVQDGLIKAGVIFNDKYENIGEPKYLWERAPIKLGFITIEILQVTDDIEIAHGRALEKEMSNG